MKFETANGHTKASIIDVIRKRFTGKALSDTHKNHHGKPFCAYANAAGQRCAIGLYIPDGHAGQAFTGPAYDLMTQHPDLQELMPFEEREALDSFQQAHDNLQDGDTVEQQRAELIQWVEEYVA